MVRYYRLCSLTVECVLLLMRSSGRGQGGGMVRLCAAHKRTNCVCLFVGIHCWCMVCCALVFCMFVSFSYCLLVAGVWYVVFGTVFITTVFTTTVLSSWGMACCVW